MCFRGLCSKQWKSVSTCINCCQENTLVCKMIRYRLVQVRQNLEKKKTNAIFAGFATYRSQTCKMSGSLDRRSLGNHKRLTSHIKIFRHLNRQMNIARSSPPAWMINTRTIVACRHLLRQQSADETCKQAMSAALRLKRLFMEVFIAFY